MFYVKRGTPGHVTNNLEVTYRQPWYTSKDLIFKPHERMKAEQGKIAFRRDGYFLFLDAKDVTVADNVYKSIEVCLERLSQMVQKEDDQQTILSLIRRKPLSVLQIIMAAHFVERYRFMLPAQHVRNVLTLLPKKKQRA